MQSIMTDDTTLSRGQKNHAPRGVDRGAVSVRQAPSPGRRPPLSRTFLPQRLLCRSQRAAIYESMT